jgi:hypothetical protein
VIYELLEELHSLPPFSVREIQLLLYHKRFSL